jgi:hypothetical protein
MIDSNRQLVHFTTEHIVSNLYEQSDCQKGDSSLSSDLTHQDTISGHTQCCSDAADDYSKPHMALAGNLLKPQNGTFARIAKLQACIASSSETRHRLEQTKKELSIALALSDLRNVLTK